MNKIAIFCSVFLLVSCSSTTEPQKQEISAPAGVVPCSYSCVQNSGVPCSFKTVSQVQKPRVTEIMPKKRPCCNDENPNVGAVIPDSPEIYVISANRTLRSMLVNKDSLLKNNARIYVAETVNNEQDMPTGYEKGTMALKRGLMNAGYDVVNDRTLADFILTNEISWFDTATKTIPAIKYSLGLYNTHGQKLGEWSEILHQVNGDRSWW